MKELENQEKLVNYVSDAVILLPDKPFKAKIQGEIRNVAPAIIVGDGKFGIAIFYKNILGMVIGLACGAGFFPVKLEMLFKGMKMLRFVKDFDVWSRFLPAVYSASHEEMFKGNSAELISELESIIGAESIRTARREKISVDEFETFLINLNNISGSTDKILLSKEILNLESGSKDFFPNSQIIQDALAGNLKTGLKPKIKLNFRVEPTFTEKMEYNSKMAHFLRREFENGKFTIDEMLDFLGKSRHDYNQQPSY